RLVNVEVADREAIAGAGAVWEAVEREESALEGRGRGLLRPSGTEPLVRVMAEAPADEEAREGCGRLVGGVRRGPRSRWRWPSTLNRLHGRNRGIRRRASLPRPPHRRAREARVPRLRLGRGLGDRGRPRGERARRRKPLQPARGDEGPRRAGWGSRRRRS